MDPEMLYMMWLKNKLLTDEEREYLASIEGNDEIINEIFGSDTEFSKDGIEGICRVGTAGINGYQIARATQAFSNDLIRKANGRVGNGVAIAFDTRETSTDFSDTVARVLLGNGIGTAIFLKPTSLPQLKFAIRYLGLEGGIMISSGSKAPETNGFKVYNKDGNQLSEEEVSTVINEYNKIQMVSQIHKYVGYLRLNSIHMKIGPSNDLKFVKAELEKTVNDDFDKAMPIVYSPLHGTGSVAVPSIFAERGFKNFYLVKEQAGQKGCFSTIEIPDVDDPSVYAMAIDLADEKGSDLVLVTNPDCSKAGAAVRDEEGIFVVLTEEQKEELINSYLKENGLEAYEQGDGAYECMLIGEIAGVYKKLGKKLIKE